MADHDEVGAERAEVTESRRTGARSLVTVYLKGAAMGAADTIPGVSGGTIALITGIYERFVTALAELDPSALRYVPRLHTADGRRGLVRSLSRMDFFFLVALALGVFTAVLTLSQVVHTALVSYPAPTFAFFFGLIAASAVVLYDAVSVESGRAVAAAVAGFVVAFLVTGVSEGGVLGHSLPVVFGAGAVGITAMVLPGISGAFILLLLGQYEFLTGTLSAVVDGAVGALTGGSSAGLASGLVTVAAFGSGAVVGLLTVARVIRWALAAYRAATLAFLVSLMVGSLRLPVVRVLDGVAVWTPGAAAAVGGAALAGAAAVLALDRYTADLDY